MKRKNLTYYSIVIVCFIGLASSEIFKFTDKNFEESIPSHTVLFVKFYLPGCERCKEFEPQFLRASKDVASRQLPVGFAEVNCASTGKETCKKYEVKGYPTIKVFNFGQFMFNYDGPKTADSIVKFVRLKVEPGSQEIKNPDDMSACLAGIDNVVIGFFHQEGSSLEKTFHKLANALKEEYKFAHTYSNKIMTIFGHRNDIVLFRSEKLKTTLEQDQLKFEGEPSLYNLRNWVASNYHGLAGFRTPKNIELFKSPLVVVYFDVNFEDKSSKAAYYRNRVIMAARKFGPKKGQERVNFAVSDLKDFKKELEDFGITEVPTERVVVTVRDSEQRRFLMNNTAFSSESLEEFVSMVISGKVDPYIKSVSPPKHEEVYKSSIVTTVGKTFEKIVLDPSKDVLVQLFTPWSSDCRVAMEVLEKVARKLQNETNIRVAKIDATVNDIPSPYAMKGYPTVYLAKKHFKTKPILYEGQQKIKDYLAFVAANSTEPLLGYDRNGKKIIKEEGKENGTVGDTTANASGNVEMVTTATTANNEGVVTTDTATTTTTTTTTSSSSDSGHGGADDRSSTNASSNDKKKFTSDKVEL